MKKKRMLIIVAFVLAGIVVFGSCSRRCASMKYHNRDVKMGIAH